jgi:hypothetical protein
MHKLGRILFVIFTFPAILYCDGWRLTLTGAWAFIRGDHLKTHNVQGQRDAACGGSAAPECSTAENGDDT